MFDAIYIRVILDKQTVLFCIQAPLAETINKVRLN